MKIGDAFPSKWLKADDLKGRRLKVVIDRVQLETISDEEKPVMYFRGKDKGMVMNQTNAGRLTVGFGTDDTEEWSGKEIILQSEPVQFQGRTVQGLRVQVPQPEPSDSSEEEIPF